MLSNRATVGSSVRIKGTLVGSRGKQKVELQAKDVRVLGESPLEPTVLYHFASANPSLSRYSPRVLIQRITFGHINNYVPEPRTWLVFSDCVRI